MVSPHVSIQRKQGGIQSNKNIKSVMNTYPHGRGRDIIEDINIQINYTEDNQKAETKAL